MELRNDQGQLVRLLRPLTRPGGEGQVYEIAGTTALVAKIYHHPVDAQKVAKLRYQIQAGKDPIRAIAAWPSGLLCEPSNAGKVRGIIMPRMAGKEVHRLYGPSDRAVEFPAVGWDFLIHVAMNCAAAFETLHEHGAVMADVNEGNLLVKESDGQVGLIDCDSYQVRNGSGTFYCDVGIPMWTPPELQGRNFRGLERTPNHDRFGLAVIVFRLLFMGRHPFAGVPIGRDQFEMEEAIKQFLFAFSQHVWARGVKAPPHTLPLAAVPDNLRKLFERAFLPGSERANARPSGREWALELKALLAALKKGCLDPGHKYWHGLTVCPWCNIVDGGGPNYFISVSIHIGSAELNTEFGKYWAAIEGVLQGALMREHVVVPSIGTATPRPMPVAKPQAFNLNMPTMPAKPVAATRRVVAPPQLPPRPQLKAPVRLPMVPMGPSEGMARLSGLGMLFFGLVAVFCQMMKVHVALYGAAWALVVCMIMVVFNWRAALKERGLRREAERQARREERQRAEEALAQQKQEHDGEVQRLMANHSAEVAEAEAEYRHEWLRRDQDYQNDYNVYLAEKRIYDAALQKHNAAVELWTAECEARKQNEAHTQAELSKSIEELKAMLCSYQATVKGQAAALQAARSRFEQARADELADMRLLHQKRQELQLQQFLAGQLIQNATIDGIGKGRKATLNAYGIDSAADITRGIQVPGFGQVLIGNLIAWRSYCEKAFRYNPNVPLPPAEVNAVKLKHAKRRQAALAELRSGATKLESLEQTTRMAASRTRMAILHFSRGHVQAIADLTVCH